MRVSKFDHDQALWACAALKPRQPERDAKGFYTPTTESRAYDLLNDVAMSYATNEPARCSNKAFEAALLLASPNAITDTFVRNLAAKGDLPDYP